MNSCGQQAHSNRIKISECSFSKKIELYTMCPLYQNVNIQLYYTSIWSVASTYPISSSMSDSEKQHVNCLFEMQR